MNELKNISISTGTIIRVALIGIGIYGLFYLKSVLLPVLVAIVIASFVEVISIDLKERYRIPRKLSVVLLFFIGLTMLGLLIYFVLPMIVNEFGQLAGQLSKILPKAQFLKPFSDQTLATGAQKIFDSVTDGGSVNQVVLGAKQVASSISAGVFGSLTEIFGGLLNFILILVMSFYLSMQDRGVETFLRIITPSKNEEMIVALWSRVERKIAKWLKGQIMLGLIIFLLSYTVLSIAGVKYALVLALLCGALEMIPYGITFGIIPSVLVTLFEVGPTTALWVLVAMVIIQQAENYILVPMLFRKIIGVPPLIVIIALLVGFKLAGLLGMILAMPMAVLLLEILDNVQADKIHRLGAVKTVEEQQ